MKKVLLLLFCFVYTINTMFAVISSGGRALEFEGLNENNEAISLSDFTGKYVVLEWLNFGCPFVQKYYRPGKMQELQQKLTSEGVIWVSIISSAPGKQGHMSPEEAMKALDDGRSKATTIILDETGVIGRTYKAVCTPQTYLISPDGTIIYQGAIDNKTSFRTGDSSKTTDYLIEAWDAHSSGRKIKTTDTRPLGCSVKY